MAVTNTAIQVVDATSEAAGTVDSMSELYSELSPDSTIHAEGKKYIESIEEVRALAVEAGMTAEEVDGLAHLDKRSLKSLQGNLGAVTRAIRTAKRGMRLFQKKEDKAHNAVIESNEIHKEQLAQLHRLVTLQNEEMLAPIKERLREMIEKRKRIHALKDELKRKGATEFRTYGLLKFPPREQAIEKAIGVSRKFVPPLLSLVFLVQMIRLIFYFVGFRGVGAQGDILRDTLVTFALLGFYPELVRMILSGIEDLSQSIAIQTSSASSDRPVVPTAPGFTTEAQLYIEYVHEWIKFVAFMVIDLVMTFGIYVMILFVLSGGSLDRFSACELGGHRFG
jgi:hypothetical protein